MDKDMREELTEQEYNDTSISNEQLEDTSEQVQSLTEEVVQENDSMQDNVVTEEYEAPTEVLTPDMLDESKQDTSSTFNGTEENMTEEQTDLLEEQEQFVLQEEIAQQPEKKNKKFAKKFKNRKAKKVKSNDKGGKAVRKVVGLLDSKSIRFKLIGAFLIPIVFIIVLGTVSYFAAASALSSSFTDSSQTAINMTSDYYDLMFTNVKATITDLVNNGTMQEYYSGNYSDDSFNEGTIYQSLKSNLSSTVLANKAISNVYIIGSYGKGIYTAAGKLQDTGEYDNIKNSAEGKMIDQKKTAWFTSRSYMDDATGSKSPISFGRQLLGTSKKGVGYIFTDFDASYVKSPLEQMDLGVDHMVVLVSPDGGEIVSSNYFDVDSTKKYVIDEKFYQEALESDEDTGNVYVRYNGKKQLFIYSKTGDGFMVCALIPQREILAKAYAIGNITVTVAIIAVILAVLVGGYLSNRMSNSVKSIMENLQKTSEGDFTITVPVTGKDEFGRLATSTNSMIGNVKGLIEKTKNVSGKVDDSTEVVAKSARQLLAETKEITMAIEEIEHGVVQQAEDSEDCLRQMDDLSDKINEVQLSSERIGQITEETTESVKSGLVSIEELKENAGSTVEITHSVIEEILQLKDSSKQIDKIIGVINEIAEQTNLLSLNASIEAARAGEAGRGFSVVASEIGKLAEQSVKSANEIRKIINEINNKTNNTVTIAKRAEDVVEVQGKSLENASQVFNDIHSQFAELAQNLENITGQIEKIADAKTQTIDAIQSISAVSQETAASSEEVTETANRQLKAVEELNRASEDLEVNAKDLSDAIDLFRV